MLLYARIYSRTKPEHTTHTFVLCYLICIVHHNDKGSRLLRQPPPPPYYAQFAPGSGKMLTVFSKSRILLEYFHGGQPSIYFMEIPTFFCYTPQMMFREFNKY